MGDSIVEGFHCLDFGDLAGVTAGQKAGAGGSQDRTQVNLQNKVEYCKELDEVALLSVCNNFVEDWDNTWKSQGGIMMNRVPREVLCWS